MRKDDATYFRQRALQEQSAAQAAACEAARSRHEELATMYRFRAAALTKRAKCSDGAMSKHLDARAA